MMALLSRWFGRHQPSRLIEFALTEKGTAIARRIIKAEARLRLVRGERPDLMTIENRVEWTQREAAAEAELEAAMNELAAAIPPDEGV